MNYLINNNFYIIFLLLYYNIKNKMFVKETFYIKKFQSKL